MVEKGDIVALANGKNAIPLMVSGEMVRSKNLGIVDTSRFLNANWGDVFDINEKQYTLVMPTLSDRISMVKRMAQIVTLKDSGVLVARTGIRAGDVVIEAGAGSGALTIALCHAVMPAGQVITYEIRDDFADIARRNVENAGYGEASTIKVGDVSEGIEEKNVAAVVLDMPEPWKVVKHAWAAILPGGVFAAYVPTVNQVEKVVREARDVGFSDIHCTETIEREMEVGPGGTRPSFEGLGHTGYIITARRF